MENTFILWGKVYLIRMNGLEIKSNKPIWLYKTWVKAKNSTTPLSGVVFRKVWFKEQKQRPICKQTAKKSKPKKKKKHKTQNNTLGNHWWHWKIWPGWLKTIYALLYHNTLSPVAFSNVLMRINSQLCYWQKFIRHTAVRIMFLKYSFYHIIAQLENQ